ncbi:MAG: Gfo/Idh/MocA family oxidoreductase [Armatimonadota bacterium]
MVRVGLVGMGFMGQQHFNIYRDLDNVELVAVCDKDPERVAETAPSIGGNIGEATELDLSDYSRYVCMDDMLDQEELDCVDLCTPTFLHSEMTLAALEAGCNAVCEKPMARTVDQCDEMIAAARSNDRMLFVAQCIRFWPEYEVLAQMIENGDLGRILSARFIRQSPTPTWASDGWLMNPELSGGAMLDLHIHDVDYILSVFGKPAGVQCNAANLVTEGDAVDHVQTQYLYDDFVCTALGGWVYPESYPFNMAFEVLGEKGVLEFSVNNDPMLQFYPFDGEPVTPDYEPGTGYERELAYFMECIDTGEAPDRITPEDARDSVRMIMAEIESVNSGEQVDVW